MKSLVKHLVLACLKTDGCDTRPLWIERQGHRGIEILSYLAVELAMGGRVVGHFLRRIQDCRPDGGQARHDGWRNSIYDVVQSGGGLFCGTNCFLR
jgi:hypothetical protein